MSKCQTEHIDALIQFVIELTSFSHIFWSGSVSVTRRGWKFGLTPIPNFQPRRFSLETTGLDDFLCISKVYIKDCPLGQVFQVNNIHTYLSPAHNPVAVQLF